MKNLSLNFYTFTKIQPTLKIQNKSLQTISFVQIKAGCKEPWDDSLLYILVRLHCKIFWKLIKTSKLSDYIQIICLYGKWIYCKCKAVRCSVRKMALLQRWHCCEILAARTAVQGCAVTSTIVSCFIATE